MTIRNKLDNEIFNQTCAQYLRSLGFNVYDGEQLNCPYRPGSDSGAFSINGNLWHDFVMGAGGNVWTLALIMKGGDRKDALESLCKSAGVPFVGYKNTLAALDVRTQAERVLRKVYHAFRISESTTPANVIEYLESRKVTATTRPYFGFIPEGELKNVLTEEETDLTGLGKREGQLILWYFKEGQPVYYCTRDIETKKFKKAFIKNGALVHPIWNHDALYTDPQVVWAEGMFDCISLLEMGYGVMGEITCNLIGKHKQQLLTALRWRHKYHPEWTFTICLDNDKMTPSGRRPGNEAAERIALWLWSQGVDVKWVKHNPSDSKIDINDLHQHGLESQIKQMIDGAEYLSKILPADPELCLRHFVQMLSRQDYRGAERMRAIISEQKENASLADIVKLTHTFLWEWRNVYSSDIKEIFMFGSDVYVIFAAGRFGKNSPHYEVFKSQNFTANMRKFQINPAYNVKLSDLNIEYRRPTWRVARNPRAHADTYNLFAPSPLLLQNPVPDTALPDIWSRLLDNLGGTLEKEWLLNHLAVYVQTLEKPKTIPVLVGTQGTGKNSLAKLFGEGIGGYSVVGNTEVEADFNEYLMSAVVLLDELASNQRESNHLKNKLKSFINENQSINIKHRNRFSAELNNYVIIASNEAVHHVPLVIEKDDRRYTIITGGKNRNLAHEEWFDYGKLCEQLPDFMLYLLSRAIDVKKASIPLVNAKKVELTEMGEDLRVSYVREYTDNRRAATIGNETERLSCLCDEINKQYGLQYKLTSKTLKPILVDLGYGVIEKEHQLHVVIQGYSEATTTDLSSVTTTTTTCTPVKDEYAFLDDDDELFAAYEPSEKPDEQEKRE